MSKRVAVLTGGGDVPGLNMCIKSLVYHLIDLGYEPIGVRKGWEGFIQYNPHDPTTYSDHFIELTKNAVRPIDRTPGSFLHSSRLEPRRTPVEMVPEPLRQPGTETQDMTEHIKDVVQRLGYGGLIVIGDDDMLQYAAYLSQQGVPIIGIPKTIHNNINGTDYSLGFSTGLARGVSLIHELRALAGSREQIIVIETFAAKSGFSSLMMGFLAGVDRVVIPEVPYDPMRLAQLVVQDRRENPTNYAVVTVCDGSMVDAARLEQHQELLSPAIRSDMLLANSKSRISRRGRSLISSGVIAAELLRGLTGQEVILQTLTYMLRTGSPDGQDLLGATNFAFTAARLFHEGKLGRMAAFKQNTMWTHIDLNEAIGGVKALDVDAWYDRESYKPKLSLIWSAENE
jgi:6-phosphofructokinase 1